MGTFALTSEKGALHCAIITRKKVPDDRCFPVAQMIWENPADVIRYELQGASIWCQGTIACAWNIL